MLGCLQILGCQMSLSSVYSINKYIFGADGILKLPKNNAMQSYTSMEIDLKEVSWNRLCRICLPVSSHSKLPDQLAFGALLFVSTFCMRMVCLDCNCCCRWRRASICPLTCHRKKSEVLFVYSQHSKRSPRLGCCGIIIDLVSKVKFRLAK